MNLKFQNEWVLHALIFIESLPEERAIPAAVLAEYYDVPKEYFAKAMQKLAREGILETTTGPKGGYRLARSSDEISFLDIIEAIEGTQSTFQCTEIRKQGPCAGPLKAYSAKCLIAKKMHEADLAWRDSLDSVKLSEVARVLKKELSPELSKRRLEWLEKKS